MMYKAEPLSHAQFRVGASLQCEQTKPASLRLRSPLLTNTVATAPFPNGGQAPCVYGWSDTVGGRLAHTPGMHSPGFNPNPNPNLSPNPNTQGIGWLDEPYSI